MKPETELDLPRIAPSNTSVGRVATIVWWGFWFSLGLVLLYEHGALT